MDRTLTFQINGSPPDDEQAAAAVAAIVALLSEATPAMSVALHHAPWRASGKLVHQGLAPLKISSPPTWNRIERLRRHASGGFYGVVGL